MARAGAGRGSWSQALGGDGLMGRSSEAAGYLAELSSRMEQRTAGAHQQGEEMRALLAEIAAASKGIAKSSDATAKNTAATADGLGGFGRQVAALALRYQSLDIAANLYRNG